MSRLGLSPALAPEINMALRPCPECGAQISDVAPACPHCGFQRHPIILPRAKTSKGIGCIPAAVIILGALYAIFQIVISVGSSPPKGHNPPPTPVTVDSKSAPDGADVSATSPFAKHIRELRPFIVTINISVTGGRQPIIHGLTNLPDDTRMFFYLKPPVPDCIPNCAPISTSGALVGDDVIVKNGSFTIGPDWNTNAWPRADRKDGLNSGMYTVYLGLNGATSEPDDVKAIIGSHGQFMRGPYVTSPPDPRDLLAFGFSIQYTSSFIVP